MSYIKLFGLNLQYVNIGKGEDKQTKFSVNQKSYIKDSTAATGFGYSCDTKDNVAVVGAYRTSTLLGKAYIYDINDGELTLNSIITPTVQSSSSTQKTWFGFSVSTDGDWVAISAPYDNKGCVYLYKKSGTGWSSTPTQIITPDAMNSGNKTGTVYGFSVSMKNNVLVIGYPGYNGSVGGIDVYTLSGDTWTSVSTDNTYTLSVKYGFSVSTDGTYIVIGGTNTTTTGGTNAGGICILKISGSTITNVIELQAPGTLAGTNNNFGYSVSISNNIVAVGAPNEGNGQVFVYDVLGNNTATLTVGTTSGTIIDSNVTSTSKIGTSISIGDNGSVIIAGAPGYNSNGGTVYMFQDISGTWGSTANTGSQLLPSPASNTFGTSVSMDGGFILSGAYSGGAVYAFI